MAAANQFESMLQDALMESPALGIHQGNSLIVGDCIRDPMIENDPRLDRVDSRPKVQTASEFVMRYGRLPQLGIDKQAPWHYPQWLLWYVQMADMTALGSGRWDHYIRTREAGHLLDEPIPQIHFGLEGQSDRSEGYNAVHNWLDILFNEVGSSSSLSALLDWFLWGLGLADEEPRVTEKVNEKLYREVNLEPLIKMPYDYWGSVYQETKGNNRWNNNGFYCTPHTICEFMTRMVMHDTGSRMEDGRDSRTATVCDPCVGTGRFPLHASNLSYCIYGMDIDPICVAATKINGALYAPWMTWPFPQSVLGGVPLPPPPPAPLPVPAQYRQQPAEELKQPETKVIRIDEKQYRLF